MTTENQNPTHYQYKNSCTLVVPGMLASPSNDTRFYSDESSQLKDLLLFLARAKTRSNRYVGFERVLFDLFDVKPSAGCDLPVAPISYLADTDKRTGGWCLRADPVLLIPDRDELVLSGPETLSLTRSEAEHLATELNVLFKEEGWRLEASNPTRWYLHLPDNPQIQTTDLHQVRGRSINHFLPGGVNGKQWHRVMNETQMVLHVSKVNIERQNHGQPLVSSLWFWGGGELPVFGHSRWSQVWSDEALSLGLAQVTHTPRNPIPRNGKTWLANVNAPGEHLIVCDELQFQKHQEDPGLWLEGLREFAEQWLQPLNEALRAGKLDQLNLNFCDGRTFSLTNNRLRYWWYWRKPIQDYCR